MALTLDDREARLDALATALTHLLPGGWEKAELHYCAVGDDYEVAVLNGEQAGRRGHSEPIARAGTLLPRSGVLPLLRRLRADMGETGHGTWLAIDFRLHCRPEAPRWEVLFDYADDFRWAEEVSPAACAAELRDHPRPASVTPEWMARREALHEAALAFDPQAIVATPQREDDLVERLAGENRRLFEDARAGLRRYAPDAVERLLVGRLATGCWSVVHPDGAWLAVHYDGGDRDTVVPFDNARSALAHAMARVMSEHEVELNSELLYVAEVIAPRDHLRRGQASWNLGELGRKAVGRTRHSARPAGSSTENDRYVSLDPLQNRPREYFVCTPGPPPPTGGFIRVTEIFEHLAWRGLPAAPKPQAVPEPVAPPSEVLQPGTEVDAYGDPVERFVFTIGTPVTRRGVLRPRGDGDYHVYRVQKPLRGRTGLFAPWPFHPTDEDPREEPAEGWQGYHLADSVESFLRSGHLIEISGPGGEPIGPTEPTGPTESTEPTEPAWPTEPASPAEPSENEKGRQ